MSASEQKAKSGWLLSFGDVVTLLITFFIMMLATNKSDVTKLQKWTEMQLTQSYVQVKTEVEALGLTGFQVDKMPQGVRIRIQADNTFEPGSYTPTPELQRDLQAFAPIIQNNRLFTLGAEEVAIATAQEHGYQWHAQLVVEGHTDNDPIDPQSRLRNNWFLSAMRAQAVMEILRQSSTLEPEQFTISGFGQYHPIANNDSEAGKAQNRRIEILISASFELVETLETP